MTDTRLDLARAARERLRKWGSITLGGGATHRDDIPALAQAIEELVDEREGWATHAKAMEAEMMKHASEVARLSRYEKALREIADYRDNDAMLRALRIARAALTEEKP